MAGQTEISTGTGRDAASEPAQSYGQRGDWNGYLPAGR